MRDYGASTSGHSDGVAGTLGARKLEMYLIALIIISIVVSMITGAIFKRRMTRQIAMEKEAIAK